MGLFTRPVRAISASAAPQLPRATTSTKTYGPVRPMTAAAETINVSSRDETELIKRRRANSDWQSRAYSFYDSIGELTFSANLVGSVMSRVRLYPAGLTSHDSAPSSLDDISDLAPGLIDAARQAMRELSSADGGISGLLDSSAIHMFLAGEFYLLGFPATPLSPARWQVKSVDEVVIQDPVRGRRSRVFLRSSESATHAQLEPTPDGTYAARIWRKHPRFSRDATANTRALLDLCDELLLLNRLARGTERSRLNAGLLYIPDEISVSGASDGLSSTDPTDPDYGYDLADDTDDGILDELMATLTTPIEDEASASSVVPILLRGPSEYGDKITHIKFERSFDAQLTHRAESVVDRILAGLDLPKDIVTGLSKVRYSNSLAISESLYTTHIEPLALFICDALTDAFLHPVLKSRGYTDDEIQNVVVWYDPSAVTTKPNKAEASNLGLANGSLSEEAWRKYNGFSEADAPTPEELLKRQVLARAPFSDPVAEAGWREVAPNFMNAVRAQQQASSAAPVPSAVTQLLGGQPDASSAPDTQTATPADAVAPTDDPAADNPELTRPA